MHFFDCFICLRDCLALRIPGLGYTFAFFCFWKSGSNSGQ